VAVSTPWTGISCGRRLLHHQTKSNRRVPCLSHSISGGSRLGRVACNVVERDQSIAPNVSCGSRLESKQVPPDLRYRIGPRALRIRRLLHVSSFPSTAEICSPRHPQLNSTAKGSTLNHRMTSRRRVSLPSSAVHLLSETPAPILNSFLQYRLPRYPELSVRLGKSYWTYKYSCWYSKSLLFSYLLLASPPPSRVFQISKSPIWTLLQRIRNG
jgi:hypothetical protein